MKRYLVFTYESYYPQGGMDDLKLQTNSRVEAIKIMAVANAAGSHAHMLDSKTGKVYNIEEFLTEREV